MNLSEKAAYIRGLAAGLDLGEETKESRVLKELIELVSEMASDVEDVTADLNDVYDVVEEMDEDLTFIAEEVFGEEDGCGCGHDHGEDLYEIVCPNCGEDVTLTEDMLMEESVICPDCGKKIEIELDCDCGDDCEGSCSLDDKE